MGDQVSKQQTAYSPKNKSQSLHDPAPTIPITHPTKTNPQEKEQKKLPVYKLDMNYSDAKNKRKWMY